MTENTAHEKTLEKNFKTNQGDEGSMPVGKDKDGDIFSTRGVYKDVAKEINSDTGYFNRRAEMVNEDLDKANDLIEKSFERLGNSLGKLIYAEKNAAEGVKKISGKVRDSTQKLSDGLSKIEKLANFDRLEKYVLLLERADKAISSLAKLEETGKLQKIAAAVR